MKNLTPVIFVFLIIGFISCSRDNAVADIYKPESRIGLWITADKSDTIEFVDNANFIRKGYYSTPEAYLYEIKDNTLYLRKPNINSETQHPIMSASEGKVVLANMYITILLIGESNAGTYYKEP